jgi:hydroxypyruvate isomerase
MNAHHSSALPRRQFLTLLGSAAACAMLGVAAPTVQAETRKGRIKQAVCPGVFKGAKLDLEGECREAARLGAHGIDLVGPEAFAMLKKYSLLPTMVPGGSGIKDGINDKKNHSVIDGRMRGAIEAAAAAGAPNVIVLAGDRKGLTDEEGLENSVLFLNNIKRLAEEKGVTVCMELLNSKIDHPGYMCDHTAWGVELCKRVDSPRVKLLYDIYHMQIMEGDIIRTIQRNFKHLGHFHTAGNPGRHQFDDTQEMDYKGICKAIAGLGYQGYLSHEYTPTQEPLETLDRMMTICEV